MEFRLLRADEIDARVSQITARSVMLLLYKDARCDMNILDETVGPMNWQRSHSRENANCTVSIWDKEKGQWVSKEDTGTESNAEKEKGLASDSFKRACTNWGIGRELYTAPSLFFPIEDTNAGKNQSGKVGCYDHFIVNEIEYTGRNIAYVKITDTNTGKTYERGKKAGARSERQRSAAPSATPAAVPDPQESVHHLLELKLREDGIAPSWFCDKHGIRDIADLTDSQVKKVLTNAYWQKVRGAYKQEG